MEELKTRLDFYLKGRMAELNTYLLMRLIEPNIPSDYHGDTTYAEIFDGAKLVYNHLKKWSEKGEAAWDDTPSYEDLMKYACDMRDATWQWHYPTDSDRCYNHPIAMLYDNTPILYICVAYAWMLSWRSSLNITLKFYLDRMCSESWQHGITYRRCMETAEMVVEDLKETSTQYSEVIEEDDYPPEEFSWSDEDWEEYERYNKWLNEATENYDRIKQENESLQLQINDLTLKLQEQKPVPQLPTCLKIAEKKKTSVMVVLHAMYKAGWIIGSTRDDTIKEAARLLFGEKITSLRQLLSSAKQNGSFTSYIQTAEDEMEKEWEELKTSVDNKK